MDLNQKKGYSQREVKRIVSLKEFYQSRADYNRGDQGQAKHSRFEDRHDILPHHLVNNDICL